MPKTQTCGKPVNSRLYNTLTYAIIVEKERVEEFLLILKYCSLLIK